MTEPQPPQGYYAASAPTTAVRLSLHGDVRADVCVIGGGFTGLSAALHLARAGAKTVLLEANSVGFAASGRNGGQIHSGHRKDQAELERWLGKEHARDLWALAEESKVLVRTLAAELAPHAAVKPGLIIAAHDKTALHDLENEVEHLHRYYDYSTAQLIDADETFRLTGAHYHGAKLDNGGGHLHPLRYAYGLASGAEAAGAVLYEKSHALQIEQSEHAVTVRTDGGKVTADHILLATDAFSGEIAPELAPYIGHVESFISATAPLPPDIAAQIIPSDMAVADTRHVLDYYRKSDDNRLLFAGREGYWSLPSDIAAVVRPKMLKVYPQLRDVPTEYAWSGTVGITRTRMPHFGKLSTRVFFAHGYSGHGVALSSLGGKLMAEAAMGNSERFDVIARIPAQKFPGGTLLRKLLVAAALLTFKLMDAI
jgi:gamma-glutamylputrescine oxidase